MWPATDAPSQAMRHCYTLGEPKGSCDTVHGPRGRLTAALIDRDLVPGPHYFRCRQLHKYGREGSASCSRSGVNVLNLVIRLEEVENAQVSNCAL